MEATIFQGSGFRKLCRVLEKKMEATILRLRALRLQWGNEEEHASY